MLADLPVAGAEKDVTLSMAAGPGTLQAAGDIYRRAVPKHVKVVPNVSLRRTQAARVKLAPGEYFYVFDVFDGEGAFTLKAACGAVELSKHDFAADERQGDVFDFPVT